MKLAEFLAQTLTSREQFLSGLHDVSRYNRDNFPLVDREGKPLGSEHAMYVYGEDGVPVRDKLLATQGVGWPFAPVELPGHTDGNLPAKMWWVVREQARYGVGQYLHADALHLLHASFPAAVVHVRPNTAPGTVFYTPDANYGERDRQVEISLGRLLKRLYPHCPDELIQHVEAQFRAELSNELEIIGPEGIADAYVGCGAGSCMTYKKEHWGLPVHPTEVYNAPGFGLAVVRDKAGRITARALIWVNPDNANDKRFVRVYGDAMLRRRLMRNGFRPSGLAGTRIKRIPLPEKGQSVFVLPYIDTKDEREHNEHKARGTLLDVDPRYIRIVNQEEYSDMSAAGFAVGPYAMTGGYTSMPTDTLDALNFTCPVTGQRGRASPEDRWLWRDGARVRLSVAGYTKLVRDGVKLTSLWTVDGDNGIVTALFEGEVPTFQQPGRMRFFVDTDANREHFGFCKLDATLYPDKREWVLVDDDAVVRTHNRRVILAEDAVDVVVYVDPFPQVRLYHTSEVPSEAKPVARTRRSRAMLAMPDVKVEKTVVGSRSVVVGVHPVVRLDDGRVEYQDNVHMKVDNEGDTLMFICRGMSQAQIQEKVAAWQMDKLRKKCADSRAYWIKFATRHDPKDIGVEMLSNVGRGYVSYFVAKTPAGGYVCANATNGMTSRRAIVALAAERGLDPEFKSTYIRALEPAYGSDAAPCETSWFVFQQVAELIHECRQIRTDVVGSQAQQAAKEALVSAEQALYSVVLNAPDVRAELFTNTTNFTTVTAA